MHTRYLCTNKKQVKKIPHSTYIHCWAARPRAEGCQVAVTESLVGFRSQDDKEVIKTQFSAYLEFRSPILRKHCSVTFSGFPAL